MSKYLTRESLIAYCTRFPQAYEDYPFDDPNWTVMRRRDNGRGFAWIFEREGTIWMNVKARPDWALFWRDTYASVLPAYHMNKKHWNSLVMNGTLPDEFVEDMISESFRLCGKEKKTHEEKV